MDIRVEPTPNPATLKFLPGRAVMGEGAADFPDAARAERSPLAKALFEADGVAGVFLGTDFVSVTKSHDAEWEELRPALTEAIAGHFAAGAPILLDEDIAAHNISAADDYSDDPVVAQIQALFDERIRPAVAQDGGDIVFHGFERGVVYLFMRGACAGCPSSAYTLRMGIENMLKHYVPEVVEVRQVL